jgi:16S rRNA (guanine527-N7)-methyltransferase
MDRQRSTSTRGSGGLEERPREEERALALGRPLAAAEHATLDAFAFLLRDANTRFNLTSVHDPAGIERRHLLESLTLVRWLEDRGALPPGAMVVDVGSGGGLPGIPLAVVRPDLKITLLEATRKKADFLQETASRLTLERVTVLAARAEEAGHSPDHRERYDLAVARAVAPLAALAELTLPLVRTGGRLAAVKGSRVAEEVAGARTAIERCGGQIERIEPLVTASGDPLFVVLAVKVAPTPPGLPRRPGMPAKRPLH